VHFFKHILPRFCPLWFLLEILPLPKVTSCFCPILQQYIVFLCWCLLICDMYIDVNFTKDLPNVPHVTNLLFLLLILLSIYIYMRAHTYIYTHMHTHTHTHQWGTHCPLVLHSTNWCAPTLTNWDMDLPTRFYFKNI
jgi:hypothetical protein